MKKSYLIFGIVILLAILAGAYVMNRSGNPPDDNNEATTAEQDQNTNGRTTLKQLLGMEQDQMCTYTYTNEEGLQSSGTVYMSNGKMRGNFESSTEGTSYMGSMINDGTYIYTWTDETDQGVKMTIPTEEAIEEPQENAQPKNDKIIDQNLEMDYTCSAWDVDNTMFTPPTDITFTDLSEMMQSIAPESIQLKMTKSEQCGTCDNLEGEPREECRKALQCE